MPTDVYRKALFEIPDNLVYLDGNSLGPLPKNVSKKVAQVINAEWGPRLIRGWNECQWMQQPCTVGDRVAKLIGASQGSVVLGDTLSIKVYQALSAALKMRPGRRVILSDKGNFPTDLYMAQGLINTLGSDYSLRLVEPSEIESAINESVAAVMLTQVDYRSGRLHDMQKITKLTRDAGAVSIWDLAHSAGALPVHVEQSQCEFAVGCTYKYMNGGPGAPAFIYIRPDLITETQPALAGWLGHDAPFAFESEYRPANSIARMRVGTPPVLQVSALDAALNVWDGISMSDVREASIVLSELFIQEVEARCPALQLASPRNAAERGSQVSFSYEHGYATMQALIDHGVIGDFRAPDIMRFGFTPLYINEQDVHQAVERLANILEQKIWKQDKYQVVKSVT